MRVRIDMTSGPPLRRMLSFCAPMLVGSVLMQLSNLVDSLIVSRAAGISAFAGIAAAAPVAFLATGFLMGFCNGFLIPIALHVGAGDRDGADRFSAAALLLTGGMALLVAVPSAALTDQLIALAGTPGDIAPEARDYLRVVLMGMPVPLLSMALWGILRAEGDTRTPFRYQMLGAAMHLALDVVLIAGLRMGAGGAACASLIAHAIASGLCLRRLVRGHPAIFRLLRFGVRPEMMRKMLLLGAPIGLTNLLASAGSTAFQFAVNSLGSSAVTAVAASDRLLSLAVMPAMMLGGVIEVFSGQNFGANRPDRIRIGVKRLYLLLVSFLVPAMLLIVAGSRAFVPLLIGRAAPDLTDLARRYMLWCALFMPLQCLNVLLKNVLQGIGLPQRAVVASVYDLVARLLCAMFGTAQLGFLAVCAVNPAAWALSALALIVPCRAIFSGAARRGGGTSAVVRGTRKAGPLSGVARGMWDA